jgi:hypothetical protein
MLRRQPKAEEGKRQNWIQFSRTSYKHNSTLNAKHTHTPTAKNKTRW